MTDKNKEIVPKYEFKVEEGDEKLQPSKRKIAKTMEVTETFTYYDALAYCMKMEKAVADKKAEIEGLQSMIEAYRKELVQIEKALDVTKADEEYHAAVQKKLQEEEALNKCHNCGETAHGLCTKEVVE